MTHRPIPEWLLTKPIAHRGLHNIQAGIPENSMPAFDAAMEAGYPIELDVQQLSDGTLIVFHDPYLTRATGVRRLLADTTFEQLRDLRLFETQHAIPSLNQVLEHVAGRVPLLIELKRRPDAPHVVRDTLPLLRQYQGSYAVQSFDPFTVAQLRRALPQIAAGQIGGPLSETRVSRFDKLASRTLLTLFASRADFINFDLRALPSAWVKLVASALRLPVLCWTVRTAEDLDKARALGLNFVFEGLMP